MRQKRKCNIQFTQKSREDFEKLPTCLIQDCIDQLYKLENDIELGKKLRNQQGRDLSSCRKLYFGQATYRIVYRELDNTKLILEIEATDQNGKILLPDFLNITADVTKDSMYSNYEISKRNYVGK